MFLQRNSYYYYPKRHCSWKLRNNIAGKNFTKTCCRKQFPATMFPSVWRPLEHSLHVIISSLESPFIESCACSITERISSCFLEKSSMKQCALRQRASSIVPFISEYMYLHNASRNFLAKFCCSWQFNYKKITSLKSFDAWPSNFHLSFQMNFPLTILSFQTNLPLYAPCLNPVTKRCRLRNRT